MKVYYGQHVATFLNYVNKTYYKNTQQRSEDTDNWISCRHLSLSKQHYHHMPPCTGHSSLGIMLQISFTKTQCFLEMIYSYAYEKNFRFGQKTTAYSGRRGRCLLCRHKAQTTNKSRRWNSLGLGSSSWQLDRSYDWDETRYAGTLDISSERMDGRTSKTNFQITLVSAVRLWYCHHLHVHTFYK